MKIFLLLADQQLYNHIFFHYFIFTHKILICYTSCIVVKWEKLLSSWQKLLTSWAKSGHFVPKIRVQKSANLGDS